MAITPFLAMTAAEMGNCAHLPPKIAWMACHFSPYGRGLSNLPPSLPEGSVLMVDDMTPMHGHDPEIITQQLMDVMQHQRLTGILLDFQRKEIPEEAELAAYLTQALPCPVIMSEHYADHTSVFLSPVPLSVPLQDYLSPWKGKDIWLDLGCWGEILTLTEEGCQSSPLPPWELPEEGFMEEILHCHYRITEKRSAIEFTLWRTEEDLSALSKEAEELGISNAVGLNQELKNYFYIAKAAV